MEIRRILIKNFKRFSEAEFTFSSGLNVVKGPNEAGKSTIHEAIIVALLDRPTGKQSERRHLSWGQDRLYKLDIAYQLPSGERQRIHKDFEASTHEVFEPKGIDSSRSGLNHAIQRALGTTSEKLFSSTASIRQDAMMDLDKGGSEISVQMQEIAMGGVSGVNEVIDRLEDKVLEFERGWKTNAPRNPGPIGQLNTQIADLEVIIQNISPEVDKRDKAQEELFQQEERITAIERELGPLEKLRKSYALRLGLTGELNKVSQLESELEEKIERIEGAENRKLQIQKRIKNLMHFHALDAQKEKELRAARDSWKARLAEVKDRERRVFEFKKRQQEEKETRKDHYFYWAIGVILLGLTVGIVGALSGQFLEDNYCTALIFTGSAIILAGALWCIVLYVRRMRSFKNLGHLLVEAQERYEKGCAKLKSAKADLEALLGTFGCATWDVFESNLDEYRKLHSDLEMTKATLSVLLGNKGSRSELEDQRKEISRTRRDIQEQLTEFEEIPELSAVEYQKLSRDIELLGKEEQERQKKIIRLEAIAEGGGSTLEDLHRSMERVAALQDRLDHALDKHQVLRITLEGLREVRDQILKNAQHELEPRLGAYLERLTQGRYSQVHVAENLQIQISRNVEDNSFISLEDLSSGTRDQVYFAARLALCDMIFHDVRPPLLMDDPFIKFDPDRKDAALQLCKELSKDRQILLFTCHDGYDAWADRVIDLGQ